MKRFYKTTVLVSLLGISNFSHETFHGAEAIGKLQPRGDRNLFKRWLTFCSNAFGRLWPSRGNRAAPVFFAEGEEEQFFLAINEVYQLVQILSSPTPFNPADSLGPVPGVLQLLREKDEKVRELIFKSKNKEDADGNTLLHKAASIGHTEAVRMLLEFGANKDARNNEGKTPLYKAILGHLHLETVTTLIRVGTDVNAIDNMGRTPLRIGIFNNYPKTVRILIQVGADVNTIDNMGRTPLFEAVSWRNTGTIRALINAGADVNAKDNMGRIPFLYEAAYIGDTRIVRVLLAAGADKEAKNQDGCTPLHIAAFRGLTKIVSILLAAGANKAAKDQDGCTPLDLAYEWRDPELEKLLR
ncbi:MAG: ankyrin repeat domain-containing protein [Holosporales bacterium]|jgi:ankyrin repeat protein|nr:ankyrin repeat domain-containing protein [Holosporales bacterium]